MDHTDVVHKTGDDLNHASWVTLGQGAEILVQCVEILDVIFRFVGCIRDTAIQRHPVANAS